MNLPSRRGRIYDCSSDVRDESILQQNAVRLSLQNHDTGRLCYICKQAGVGYLAEIDLEGIDL
jgi:hypothetical protein